LCEINKEADGLDFPPIPGEMGKKIWENVSKEAWNQWIQHQTMLVKAQGALEVLEQLEES